MHYIDIHVESMHGVESEALWRLSLWAGEV